MPDNELLLTIAEALKEYASKDLKTKAPASFHTATELHGVGSIWGRAPIERDVITAHMRPAPGLATAVPMFPSVIENPIFGSLTGYTSPTGDEPTNPCDAAPAGYVKGCNLSAAFGRVMRDTQTIEIDKVMLRANRGDFTDLRLRGSVLADEWKPANLDSDGILNIVTKSEMVIAAVNLQRKLHQLVWQGNPANNTAGGGYKEFPGLDLQIATGIKDWETGTLCPALDSDIKNFAYNLVGGAVLDIVEYLSMLMYNLEDRAERMGLAPTQFVVAMRPQLWFELSAVWPCRYLTNKCSNSGGTNVAVINDNVNTAMRDRMRANMTIDINGKAYKVVTDDGIFEHTNINNANVPAGTYASSIYVVPLSINGGFPVTYMEHVDYKAAAPDIALLNQMHEFWTDDGRYMWAIENNNFCYKLKVKTEPRIILRTPQLAGRIDAIRYAPLQHLRDFDPDLSYFADGGVSVVANETGYAVWNGR